MAPLGEREARLHLGRVADHRSDCPADLARAAALAPPVADRFLAGRGLLRQVLAPLLAVEPGAIRIELESSGRPVLRQAPGAAPLHFSLSHSGAWVAVAVAREPLGVDLECGAAGRPLLPIARRFFHPDEAARLSALPEAERETLFLRLWCAKEAWLKSDGLRLPRRLDEALLGPGDVLRVAGRELLEFALAEGRGALVAAPGSAFTLPAGLQSTGKP